MSISNIKSRVSKLSISEKVELIDFIKNSYSIFDEYSEINSCSFCGSGKIFKNGTRNGFQKYVCKDCERNFTYKTNTVISGVHSLNKWNAFVEDFMSLNITPLAELRAKLKVTQQTIFNWRHKLLSAFSKYDVKFKKEEVEFDETYFLISRKGRQGMNVGKKLKSWRKNQVGDSPYNVKLFFSFGRNSKQLELHQSHMGRTAKADLERYFTRNKFEKTTVYSDAHPSYKSFFKSSNLKHQIFSSKDHVNQENNSVHNQTINAYMRDFKSFVNDRLKGVSTKYLAFYAKWFQFINDCKNKIKSLLNSDEKMKFDIQSTICDNVVDDKIGFELFRQSEYSFVKFLEHNGRTNYGTCRNHYYYG